MLASDKSADVRLALAARLAALLPGLEEDQQSQLYAFTIQALGMLAQDEILQIRRALSTALKDYAKAPPAVVGRLARDVEREVSEPILRYCAALPDDDLLDILSHHPEPWVIATIASRTSVSPKVSEAVVATEDVPATTVLVNNPGAVILQTTLQTVIARAKDYPEWHRPIALRPEISAELARQLTGFVDAAILSVLEKRGGFDPGTRQTVAALVKRRMEYQRQGAVETAEEKIRRYSASKQLSPDVVQDALSWGEAEFATLALADLSNIHPQIVRKMLAVGTAKPVVALCWEAKLPMRLCIDVQQQLAKIPAGEILYARGGTDYPLDKAEIKWQLEFFGLKDR